MLLDVSGSDISGNVETAAAAFQFSNAVCTVVCEPLVCWWEFPVGLIPAYGCHDPSFILNSKE
jgi:hypothetical protein